MFRSSIHIRTAPNFQESGVHQECIENASESTNTINEKHWRTVLRLYLSPRPCFASVTGWHVIKLRLRVHRRFLYNGRSSVYTCNTYLNRSDVRVRETGLMRRWAIACELRRNSHCPLYLLKDNIICIVLDCFLNLLCYVVLRLTDIGLIEFLYAIQGDPRNCFTL